MDPERTQGLAQVSMASDQIEALASLSVNLSLFFRQKFMQLYSVHMKISEGLIRISGF
jgi:hypothetical protein